MDYILQLLTKMGNVPDVVTIIMASLMLIYNKRIARYLIRLYSKIGWPAIEERSARIVIVICCTGLIFGLIMSLLGYIRPQGGPP